MAMSRHYTCVGRKAFQHKRSILPVKGFLAKEKWFFHKKDLPLPHGKNARLPQEVEQLDASQVLRTPGIPQPLHLAFPSFEEGQLSGSLWGRCPPSCQSADCWDWGHGGHSSAVQIFKSPGRAPTVGEEPGPMHSSSPRTGRNAVWGRSCTWGWRLPRVPEGFRPGKITPVSLLWFSGFKCCPHYTVGQCGQGLQSLRPGNQGPVPSPWALNATPLPLQSCSQLSRL